MKTKIKKIAIISAVICVAIALVVGSIFIFGQKDNEDNAKGALMKIVGTSTEDTGAAEADIQEKGGAIYVGYDVQYEMNGGRISGHYNIYGGAVYVANGGKFTMNGGTITDCEAEYGGAIYVESGGHCVITGGEILGNRSCSAPIFLEAGATLEIADQSIIHDNIVVEKYYINFFVNGILAENRKVITNIYDVYKEELPLSLEECSGYFTDISCVNPLTDGLINFDESDLVVDGEINLYTHAATLDEFAFGTNEYIDYYTIRIDSSGLVKNLVMPAEYQGAPVKNVVKADNIDSAVKNVILSSNITEVQDNSFLNATGLLDMKIPTNVTLFGKSAFEGCTNLITINVPETITAIGERCFYGCTNLIGPIKIPDSITTIEGRTFQKCPALTGVIIPEGVTTIKTYAFSECSAILNFNLPSTLTTIGTYAFSQCKGITSMKIPQGVTTLDTGTFSQCQYMVSVDLPNGLTTLKNTVFSNCVRLTSVTLPNSLTTMGNSVFTSCERLPTIFIPSSVTSMGNTVFQNCDSMQVIYCEVDAKPGGWSTTWLGDCPGTVVWDGVDSKTIYVYVDGSLSKTLNVRVGYSLSEDDMPLSYENCCGYFLDENLSKTMPDGPVSFKEEDSINIYTRTATDLSNFSVSQDSDTGKYKINCTTNLQGEVVLPREFNNALISVVEECAFESLWISRVVLSSGIEIIEYSAFGYTHVEEIILHDKVVEVQDHAFSSCEYLEKIFISKTVKTVGDSILYNALNTANIYFEAQGQTVGFSDNWDYDCDATITWGSSLDMYLDNTSAASSFTVNETEVEEQVNENAEVVNIAVNNLKYAYITKG